MRRSGRGSPIPQSQSRLSLVAQNQEPEVIRRKSYHAQIPDSPVIFSLKAKRAQLDGELMQAEKLVARLRADLDAIDAALRVFDPEIKLSAIRPIVRGPAPKFFRHGHFSRAVLDVLRRADKPLTYREIAQRLSAEHNLNASDRHLMRDLVKKVRGTLRPDRPGLRSEVRNGEIVISAE